jgi:hypothetical protein
MVARFCSTGWVLLLILILIPAKSLGERRQALHRRSQTGRKQLQLNAKRLERINKLVGNTQRLGRREKQIVNDQLQQMLHMAQQGGRAWIRHRGRIRTIVVEHGGKSYSLSIGDKRLRTRRFDGPDLVGKVSFSALGNDLTLMRSRTVIGKDKTRAQYFSWGLIPKNQAGMRSRRQSRTSDVNTRRTSFATS